MCFCFTYKNGSSHGNSKDFIKFFDTLVMKNIEILMKDFPFSLLLSSLKTNYYLASKSEEKTIQTKLTKKDSKLKTERLSDEFL
jgi:hypothetical protein